VGADAGSLGEPSGLGTTAAPRNRAASARDAPTTGSGLGITGRTTGRLGATAAAAGGLGIAPASDPSSSGPWWRRWYVVLAALLVVLGVVALSDDNATNDPGPATPAPTSSFSLPTVATTLATTSTAPSTTIEKVAVPKLVGMRMARAKDRLADRGLTAKVRYKSTGPVRCRDGHLPVAQGRSWRPPRHHHHPRDRQGTATAATDRATRAATDRATTRLPSLLPRRLPSP
jgi:hypothetical protein